MRSSAGNDAIASASAIVKDGRAAPEYRTFHKLDHRLCLQSKLDRRHFRNGAESHAIESKTNAEFSAKPKPTQAFNAQARLASTNDTNSRIVETKTKLRRGGILDIELDEDSKQRIHSELKTRSRSEGEQLVAIDEDGKLFSVDNDGELYYVATFDAPAIATIIDAGKEREKLNQVVVEQDTRDLITVSSRDASVTSQTSILSAVTFVTEQVTTRSGPQVPIPMWIFIDKNDKQLHDDRYARRSRRWENDKALEVDSEAVAEAGTSSNAQSLPDCFKMPSKTGHHFGK